jgi:hypothetical protein
LGKLQDLGVQLTTGMTFTMLGSGIIAVVLIWLGPETRGRAFTADDK